MTTDKNMSKAIWGMANKLADEMDYSRVDAPSLNTILTRSFDHMEYIKTEIFDWTEEIANQPVIGENPDLHKRVIDIGWKAVPVAVFILAVRLATSREIEARSRRNKTNYNFGLLKLAQDLKILELQKKAWGQLQRILSAIPYQKGWFHPEGKDGWIGVIDLTLAELLHEHAALDPPSTIQRMTENRFAYIYERAKARLVDEVRRLVRKSKEISVGDTLSSFPALDISPDEGLHRLGVIRLVENLWAQNGSKDAQKEILHQLSELMKNPEQVADMTVREVGADVVRAAALNRGVSRQQVGKDLADFKGMAQADKTLQTIKDEIRALGELGQRRIVVTLRKLQGVEEEAPERIKFPEEK